MKKRLRKNKSDLDMRSQDGPRVFSEDETYTEILLAAKGLNLPDGAVEPVAKKAVRSVARWVEKRSMITDDDLNQRLALELEKYYPDLAYVFKNRGKII